MARVVEGQDDATQILRFLTEPTTDSEGKEALRITLVLTPAAAKTFTGDQAVDLILSIQSSLLKEGDERFPIIEYATEDELLESAPTTAKPARKR